jgi:hypothetical protein
MRQAREATVATRIGRPGAEWLEGVSKLVPGTSRSDVLRALVAEGMASDQIRGRVIEYLKTEQQRSVRRV